MSVIALINPAAGSVPSDAADQLARAIAGPDGTKPDIRILDVADPEGQIRGLGAGPGTLLVVWGGDGTHRTVLSVLRNADCDKLLLPGGTKNLLSRSLHGEADWRRILERALAKPRRKSIPAGMVGDELFFCALLAGSPALFAQAREDLRHGDALTAARDFGIGLTIASNLHLFARYDSAEAKNIALPQAAIIAALVGPLSQRPCLEVASIPEQHDIGVGFAWASIQSSWRGIPGTTMTAALSLTIEANGEDIPISIDGEVIPPQPRVDVRFLANAATVLETGEGQ